MRFLTLTVFGLCAAALACAEPITLTFSGTASGTAGLTPFTDEPFLFTFTSDTSDITQPSCCSSDYSTPSGTTGTVYIGGIGTGDLLDTQAVFVNQNPAEDNIGIWHYDEPDWLDLVTSAASTYSLTTSLGPITATAFDNVAMGGHYLQSALGNLVFSSVSDVTFQATVGSPSPDATPDAAPEPSSWILLGTGILALFVARVRRTA